MQRGKAPTLGAIAEQTKSSWATLIPSYDAIPPVYQGFFGPMVAEGRAFPYTVVGPSYEKFLHRTTEKLVCALEREIHVLERRGSAFEVQCYPLEEISYVEVRTVLLDSHIKICGVTKEGAPACCTVRFNSISDYLFRPIVQKVRLATSDARDPVQRSEQGAFDHLARVNYKFMSYARHSLLAGDQVVHTILQPEIRQRVLTVLGKTFYRTVFPTHMSILTDRELIMIAEEHGQDREDRYGAIWDYIPLNKIAALSLSRKGSDLLRLSIQLPHSAGLDYLFEARAEREAEELLARAKELTP